MEEGTTEGAPEAPEPDAAGDDAGGREDPWDPEVARRKIKRSNQEAANLRARLKELEPLAAKAREFEEASKSEQQKLTEALEAERSARTKAESTLLRYEVGAEKGVPPTLMRFLSGNTREEVEEAADVLLKEMGNGRGKPPGPPPERITSGAASSADDDLDPLALYTRAREGRI